MVMIGHAAGDERYQLKGGAAGDQTGREVCTRTWYDKKWLRVIRPVKPEIADKIASAMEAACANANIGYDQSQRTTCYDRAKEVNFDLSKITTKCEVDCSALVAVCVNAAGIKVSQHIWTGNEESALMATGEFESLRDSKYLTKGDHLKRGDILLSSGHTAVVLSNDNSATSQGSATQVVVKEDTYTMNMRTLKKGCKGEDVKAMQILLIGRGFSCGLSGADGDFGNATDKAVRSYQKKKNLTVDGIAGSATMSSLLGI